MVVPTLNRGPYVLDCVADLIQQSHRPLEILIVDQSSETSPPLTALAAAHRDLISYNKVSFRGLPAARNFGILRARFDAIAFVDDDIRCGPELAFEHLRALRGELVGVVAGAIDEAGQAQAERAALGRFNPWTATPSRGFAAHCECEVEHAPGGNFSVWRSVATRAGGFDEAFQLGPALYEETEFCLRVRRLGFRIYFNGKARIKHLAAAGGGCRVNEMAGYVYGLAHNRTALIRRHLRPYYLPTALVRVFSLGLAFAGHYRSAALLKACILGIRDGWADAHVRRGLGAA